MAKGFKTGGRRKGSLNKKNAQMLEMAERLGVNPFEILLQFAKGDHKALRINPKQLTPDHRLKAAGEASQYLYPKRKALEHSGPNGEPIDEFIAQFEEVETLTPIQKAELLEDAAQTLREKEANGRDSH